MQTDARVFVQFDVQPVQDDAASKKEGRPIFRDVEHIKIMVPGDKQNIIHRPVNPDDLQRFGRQYEAFQKGLGDAVTGTPLVEWPLVTRSQVAELAHWGIRCVEQLAEVSDGNLKGIGPYLALRQKARDWLEKANGGALESKLRAELDASNAQIEALKQQMAEVIASTKKAKKESA